MQNFKGGDFTSAPRINKWFARTVYLEQVLHFENLT